MCPKQMLASNWGYECCLRTGGTNLHKGYLGGLRYILGAPTPENSTQVCISLGLCYLNRVFGILDTCKKRTGQRPVNWRRPSHSRPQTLRSTRPTTLAPILKPHKMNAIILSPGLFKTGLVFEPLKKPNCLLDQVVSGYLARSQVAASKETNRF